MFILSVKTVTAFLFHFLRNHCPLPSSRKRRREEPVTNIIKLPSVMTPGCVGEGRVRRGEMRVFTFYLLSFIQLKKREHYGCFLFCAFVGFFGSPQFFFIVNTRYFCNQRKKCHNERTKQMWLATGWPSCCPHLQATTTLTLGPASSGLQLSALGRGWWDGGAGDRA